MVLPLTPSTYWPLINKPVLKDVLPLYTGVSHSYENDPGMLKFGKCGVFHGAGNSQLRSHVLYIAPLCEIEYYSSNIRAAADLLGRFL